MKIQTPYYLIDKNALARNLKTIQYVRERSGAKVLLALKCFATWSVFDLMREYMDGTTSSSLYEVMLGRQKSAVKPMLIASLSRIMKSVP